MSTPKPSNKARMAAKRQAVDTDPIMSVDTPPPAPALEAPKRSGRWEETHRRYTFHLANDLVAEAKTAAADNGLSLSALVSQGIRAELDRLRYTVDGKRFTVNGKPSTLFDADAPPPEAPAKVPAKAKRTRKPATPPPTVRPCSIVWTGTTGPEWVTLDPEAADDLFPTTRDGRPLRGLELPGELADLRAGRIPRPRAHRIAHRMAEVTLGNLLRDSPTPPAAQRAAEGIIDAALTSDAWTVNAADVLAKLAADGLVTIDG